MKHYFNYNTPKELTEEEKTTLKELKDKRKALLKQLHEHDEGFQQMYLEAVKEDSWRGMKGRGGNKAKSLIWNLTLEARDLKAQGAGLTKFNRILLKADNLCKKMNKLQGTA